MHGFFGERNLRCKQQSSISVGSRTNTVLVSRTIFFFGEGARPKPTKIYLFFFSIISFFFFFCSFINFYFIFSLSAPSADILVNMPKNKGKGGKSKRKGKNKNADASGEKRDLFLKGDEQEYAQVTKILGNCRFEAYCFDGKTRLCHVRGKFRKRVWINRDDVILLGLRDYQDEKADIIHKFSAEEVSRLKKLGEIPVRAAIAEHDLLEGDVATDTVVFANLDDI